MTKHVGPKILTIDIETSPLLARVWGLWDQNVPLNMIQDDWSVLSYSAKWLHEDRVMYKDTFHKRNQRDDKALLKLIWNLLNEADIVVGQNSIKFDSKKINARFAMAGMRPPSPYRQVDTMREARRHFGFTSNKLEYLTDKLCTKYKKLKHARFPGNELWIQYMLRNPLAQQEMQEYNEQDVRATEELYLILLPWIKGHPNVNLYQADAVVSVACPNCGSHDLKPKGWRTTQLGRYRRYLCGGCGSWPHGRKSIITKESRENLLGNVA
ncbi:DNA polymerase exonuclease subunit [Ralstonia phage phiAp1]|uniref:DNA polymerase III epsilon subunit n=1 Tax=Ralstonia phage phiAp1 TaxID=2783867 RepID=A0A1L7DSA9_9CAUD|nr:DNA polymerase exonuclease subunit [Ralstonia phage phiAp1]APU03173.1 DNA polymerase III epsilon subunit [Ralstonia phage phiAp1]